MSKKVVQFAKGFWRGFKEFGKTITILVNTILLLPVYLLGVGVTWAFAKLSKKKFLKTKLSKQGSYWEPLNLKKKPMQEYLRQF